MSISHYPSIVTDGMILCLDAASLISYSGSGSTWNDLSGRGNNATLINSPTYDSSTNRGLFTFAAASAEMATIQAQSSLSVFTVEAWMKFNSFGGRPTAILTQEYPGLSSRINYSIGLNGANGSGAYDGKLNVGFYDGTWRTTSGFTPSLNVWYHVVMTYNGSTMIQYSNGVLQSSLSYAGTPTTSGGLIRLMRRWDDVDYLDGNLSIARIYNRALSAAEVANNYNAMRGRYS